MSELNTLKDLFYLENLEMCGCGSCDEGMSCDIEKIRKDAIKHYKQEVDVECHGEPKPAFEWIKEYFNLTEEEIK